MLTIYWSLIIEGNLNTLSLPFRNESEAWDGGV